MNRRLHYFVLVLLLVCSTKVTAQVFPVSDLKINGSSSKRINLVYLPDGFTASQLLKFRSESDSMNSRIFGYSPLKEYNKFFNSRSIAVPSVDSGADHPATAGCAATKPVIDVNTYFKSTYDWAGLHRLLVPLNDLGIASTLAANTPDYDYAFVIVNSYEYGGSGGTYPTASLNFASAKVAVHEFGHSFANLGDEYWPGIYYVMERPNVTKESNPALIRWKNWLGSKGVGIYNYGPSSPESDWYHPHRGCLMEHLDSNFCPVCQQTLIDKIYSLATPIDSTFPDTSVSVPYLGSSLSFAVKLVRPEPSTLKLAWELNGIALPFKDTFATISGSSLVSGTNEIKVFVTDTTTLSRSFWPVSGYQFSASWRISHSGTGIIDVDKGSSSGLFSYKFFPQPADDQLNIAYTNKTGQDMLSYGITDLSGSLMLWGRSALSNGSGAIQIDVSALPEGNYIVRLENGSVRIAEKITVAR